MELLTTVIGLVAAACTTGCYLPQLHKSWKTRSTGDLSLAMIAALASGTSLWTLYGILRSDIVLVAANVVSLTLLLGILSFKLAEFRRRPGR
jgi:MtN3 and saliva related transmembrane protein